MSRDCHHPRHSVGCNFSRECPDEIGRVGDTCLIARRFKDRQSSWRFLVFLALKTESDRRANVMREVVPRDGISNENFQTTLSKN